MGGFFEWSAEDFCYEWLMAGDCVVESDGVVDDEVLHLDVVGDWWWLGEQVEGEEGVKRG